MYCIIILLDLINLNNKGWKNNNCVKKHGYYFN